MSRPQTELCNSCGKSYPKSEIIRFLDSYCRSCFRKMAIFYLVWHHKQGSQNSETAIDWWNRLYNEKLILTYPDMPEREKTIQKALGTYPKIMCKCGLLVFEDELIVTKGNCQCNYCKGDRVI